MRNLKIRKSEHGLGILKFVRLLGKIYENGRISHMIGGDGMKTKSVILISRKESFSRISSCTKISKFQVF